MGFKRETNERLDNLENRIERLKEMQIVFESILLKEGYFITLPCEVLCFTRDADYQLIDHKKGYNIYKKIKKGKK